ncbi:hypothetical protein [Flaviflexus equikiangi]|nr:hypothetical protein [Flaviflexus equikiangi]
MRSDAIKKSDELVRLVTARIRAWRLSLGQWWDGTLDDGKRVK